MQPTLDYLYNLQRFGIKLGLEEITKLVQALDNPQNQFKSIHVAGTNGKGSTAAFIASILQQAGYKVGLYTSPHLIRFNERIRINGKEITDKELVKYTKKIQEKVEQHKIPATFFEFTTALAYLYFAQNKVDFAVIETGMGGRLDATNVIIPEISVITNISIDHTEHLGKTKLQIAAEKAAIIKEKGLVVTAENDTEIVDLFRDISEKKNARLFVLDDEVNYKPEKSNLIDNLYLKEQPFTVSGKLNGKFTIKLLGKHQLKNASLALLVIYLLKEKGYLNNVNSDTLKLGLEKTTWSGRLEIISQKPLTIVDGAHNVEGMKCLREFIVQLPSFAQLSKQKTLPKKKILILGIAKDKEIEKMIHLIVPLADEVILSQGNYKPADLDVLEKEVKKYNKNIKKFTEVEEAIKEAIISAKEDDIILITGSLYLVGDVLKHRNLFK